MSKQNISVDFGPLDPNAAPEIPRGARLIFPGLAPFYRMMEPLSYAILRAWFGMTIVTHGYPKLFRVRHGEFADPYANVVKVIANKVHLPGAEAFGLLVTLLESFGGLFLALGFATRIVGPMLAIQMLVISLCVLWPNWAWTEHGMEYAMLMSALAGYMSIRGGGRFSIDRLIGREI